MKIDVVTFLRPMLRTSKFASAIPCSLPTCTETLIDIQLDHSLSIFEWELFLNKMHNNHDCGNWYLPITVWNWSIQHLNTIHPFGQRFCLHWKEGEVSIQVLCINGCYGEWEGWTRKPVNPTSWVAEVTLTDRYKSVRNRCVIEILAAVLCCYFSRLTFLLV